MIYNSLLILEKNEKHYQGIDRFDLGKNFSESTLIDYFNFVENNKKDDVDAYINYYGRLLKQGIKNIDLIYLGNINSEKWKFLGYDVGEDSSRRWSAIFNSHNYLQENQINQLFQKLNQYGLFSTLETAEEFLQFYLSIGDIDRDWPEDIDLDIYKIIPVFSYLNN